MEETKEDESFVLLQSVKNDVNILQDEAVETRKFETY
jgi:hypothetical protein